MMYTVIITAVYMADAAIDIRKRNADIEATSRIENCLMPITSSAHIDMVENKKQNIAAFIKKMVSVFRADFIFA